MLFFHGVRQVHAHPDVSVDLTVHQSSSSVIEIIGRVQGDFAEYRSYLLYKLYCEYLVRNGKVDDRNLNPDDLANRILPLLTFHFADEEQSEHKESQDINSPTRERKLIIKFDSKVADDSAWLLTDVSDHGFHTVFTASKPTFVEGFDMTSLDAGLAAGAQHQGNLSPRSGVVSRGGSQPGSRPSSATRRASPHLDPIPNSPNQLPSVNGHNLNRETAAGVAGKDSTLSPAGIAAAHSHGSHGENDGVGATVRSPRLAPLLPAATEGKSIEAQLEEVVAPAAVWHGHTPDPTETFGTVGGSAAAAAAAAGNKKHTRRGKIGSIVMNKDSIHGAVGGSTILIGSSATHPNSDAAAILASAASANTKATDKDDVPPPSSVKLFLRPQQMTGNTSPSAAGGGSGGSDVAAGGGSGGDSDTTAALSASSGSIRSRSPFSNSPAMQSRQLSNGSNSSSSGSGKEVTSHSPFQQQQQQQQPVEVSPSGRLLSSYTTSGKAPKHALDWIEDKEQAQIEQKSLSESLAEAIAAVNSASGKLAPFSTTTVDTAATATTGGARNTSVNIPRRRRSSTDLPIITETAQLVCDTIPVVIGGPVMGSGGPAGMLIDAYAASNGDLTASYNPSPSSGKISPQNVGFGLHSPLQQQQQQQGSFKVLLNEGSGRFTTSDIHNHNQQQQQQQQQQQSLSRHGSGFSLDGTQTGSARFRRHTTADAAYAGTNSNSSGRFNAAAAVSPSHSGRYDLTAANFLAANALSASAKQGQMRLSEGMSSSKTAARRADGTGTSGKIGRMHSQEAVSTNHTTTGTAAAVGAGAGTAADPEVDSSFSDNRRGERGSSKNSTPVRETNSGKTAATKLSPPGNANGSPPSSSNSLPQQQQQKQQEQQQQSYHVDDFYQQSVLDKVAR